MNFGLHSSRSIFDGRAPHALPLGMSVPPPPPLPNRWLLKDIDYFAGFAHAVHTYLGGVALAGAHGLSLLHQPFMSAHGMGYHFDDFLMGDERGLVEPLAAPELGVSPHAQLVIGGRPITIGTVQRTGSAAQVTAKLLQAPADSLTHVRKGRFAFVDENKTLCVNCTITPESRYAALWLRERFWRATRARERRAASSSRSNAGAGGVADAKTVTIAIHVRRGDVTYLDKYSRPSSRWVETTAMLEVLRGVCSVLGVPLARPAVRIHLVTCASQARAHHDANLLFTGTGTPLLRSEGLAGERHGRAACGRAARGVTSRLEPVCDHRRPYPHEPCGCAADGCLGLLQLGGRLMATDLALIAADCR